ncbi:MAG: cytidine deaminase [Thermoleophilia bacterium]|nr:cytidine deaminase [Thermoleophilia bacterium]
MPLVRRTPSDADRALYEEAVAAQAHAYVPYSNFRVGAAIEFADGAVVTGCNVENAAYSMAICAERTAVVRSIAEGRDVSTVRAIAVAVDGAEGPPCGACRQVLVEFFPNADIAFTTGGELGVMTVHELLPAAFMPESLDA